MSSGKVSLAVFGIVALSAIIVQIASMHLIRAPEHDELAYSWNSLFWSGRLSDPSNIAWAERPPLFWWALTFLMSLGLNPSSILFVSPFFSLLLALLLTQFVREITEDDRAALVTGLLVSLSGFVGATGARVLTDEMGTFFAAFAVYAFYKLFLDRNQSRKRFQYGIIWGATFALSLIARDENLILVPIFALMWTLLVSRKGTSRRLLYSAIFLAVFAAPIALLGLANALQLVSNLLTPIVMGGWWIIILFSATFCYIAHKAKSRFRDYGLAFLSFFILLLPFFFDNYVLGNIDYYIAGKGILARPVSHVLMLPQTGGVGANLTIMERMSAWVALLPGLVSPAVFLLAIVGLFYLFKTRRNLFGFFVLWLVLSLGYVVVTANLEDRFLLISLPPLFICSGYGVWNLFRLNRWLAVAISLVTLFLVDIQPNTPISIGNEILVLGFASNSPLWFYGYIQGLSPAVSSGLTLPMANLIDGIVALVFPLVALPLVIAGSLFPRPLMSRPIPGETVAVRVEATNVQDAMNRLNTKAASGSSAKEKMGTVIFESKNQKPISGKEITAESLANPTRTFSISKNDAKPFSPIAETPVVRKTTTRTHNMSAASHPPNHIQKLTRPREYLTPESVKKTNEEKEAGRDSSLAASKYVLTPEPFQPEKKDRIAPILCPNCGAVMRTATCKFCGATA